MAPVSPMSLLPPAYLPTAQSLQRLVMTSPQGSVSPLVSSSSSPPMLIPANAMVSPRSSPMQSPRETDTAVLDFSTKRHSGDISGLDLSKGSPVPTSESSPLDLSVTSRKRGQDDSSCGSQSPSPQPRKTPRVSTDYKTVVSPWTSPVVASHFPYFAAAVAAANSLSPKLNNSLNSHSSSDSSLWNGKMKMGDKSPYTTSPVDATKALEKMSELSKLSGDEFRSMGNSGGSGGRHSAWQSHWLNKGADQAKDVLKCVWCKQSFPSLAAMTTHMKEAKHCGVNVPVPNIQPPPPPMPQPPPIPTSSIPPSSLSNLSSSNKPSPADLNLLIKETMPLPRKLVRGQDVWLGKGAEQTRQILKCMWCGQSFRSLAEMTSHMQQTQHYTNIISQEQIISWKSSDDSKSTSGGGGGGSVGGGSTGSGGAGAVSSAGGGSTASSHVSAVLTCKVCDQAFSSLKELSNHMVKNSHYKEHIMRSITESGGRRRQTREKRKKSLPVRKLLELERAQNELKNGEGGLMMMGKMARDLHAAGRITCEKCGEKIEMAVFVDHIRMCIGGGHITSDQRNLLKSALLSNNMIPTEQHPSITQALRESRKIKKEDSRKSPTATDLSAPPPSSPGKDTKQEGKNSSPSVLNAIEKLIEKSFDSRARHGAPGYGGPGMGQGPIGSSILKRLGIDESVDYTKPLVDPQTMHLLRNYPHHPHGHFGRRERSGSESSSMSERGRTEASTPDRKFDPSDRLLNLTPRTTPEKRIQTPPSSKNSFHDESTEDEIHIKKEIDDNEVPLESNVRHDLVVKKEDMENGDDDDERRSYHSDGHNLQRGVKEELLTSPRTMEEHDEDRRSHNSLISPTASPRQPTPVRPASHEAVPSSPCRNSTSSPASSDRSGTPRSTTEKKSSGSLGALSSMFDNLSGGPSGGGQSEPTASGGKGSSHPLAALQKLCDKTETHHHPSGSRPSSSNQSSMALGASGSQTPQSATTPGAILAFSWACNDAVVTADSIMKCAFCDTPFISKGAYRHHLSKMHFVKDGVIPDPVALKSQAGGSGSSHHNSGKNSASATSSGKSPNQQNNFEESPHSKFLKYTELAKQLSSKYV